MEIKDIQHSAPSAKMKCFEGAPWKMSLQWNDSFLLSSRVKYKGSASRHLASVQSSLHDNTPISEINFISPTDEFKTFLMRLPQNFFLNSSMIQHLWSLDGVFQRRYEQLESSMKSIFKRAQRVVYKLFSLSKRCQKQPHINLPRERWTQQAHYLLIVVMINTLILNSEME